MKKNRIAAGFALFVCSAGILFSGCGKDDPVKPEATPVPTKVASASDADITIENVAATADKLVKTGDYKNYTYKPFNPVISDAEVEEAYKKAVADLIEKKATFSAEDESAKGQAVKSGDTINLYFKGYVDGEAFSGGEGTVNLTIGSGKFIPGFEDNMIGKIIGESSSIDVTFPDPYPNNADLAGKPAKFDVTVNYLVKEVEVTEENAYNGYFGFETLEECYASLRSNLESSNTEESYISAAKNDYIDKILADSEFGDISKEVEDYYNIVMHTYDSAAAMNNVDVETLITSYIGMSMDEFQSLIRASSDQRIKRQLVIGEIAKKEGIEFTDEEYKKEAEELAKKQGYSDAASFIHDRDYNYGKGSLKADLSITYYIDALFEKYAKTED